MLIPPLEIFLPFTVEQGQHPVIAQPIDFRLGNTRTGSDLIDTRLPGQGVDRVAGSLLGQHIVRNHRDRYRCTLDHHLVAKGRNDDFFHGSSRNNRSKVKGYIPIDGHLPD